MANFHKSVVTTPEIIQSSIWDSANSFVVSMKTTGAIFAQDLESGCLDDWLSIK